MCSGVGGGVQPPPDCSIRAPSHYRVGATRRGVSPRPRALHRPCKPRHPPRAHPSALPVPFPGTRHSHGRSLCTEWSATPFRDASSLATARHAGHCKATAIVRAGRANTPLACQSSGPVELPRDEPTADSGPHGHAPAVRSFRWNRSGGPIAARTVVIATRPVEPRGLEPRTSAVQGRRPPN